MWNFVLNSGLKKVCDSKSIVLSTKLVDGRACGSHLRRSTRRCCTHIIYYTSVDCNPPTPVCLDLLCNLFLHVSAVDKILIDTARRAVRLR